MSFFYFVILQFVIVGSGLSARSIQPASLRIGGTGRIPLILGLLVTLDMSQPFEIDHLPGRNSFFFLFFTDFYIYEIVNQSIKASPPPPVRTHTSLSYNIDVISSGSVSGLVSPLGTAGEFIEAQTTGRNRSSRTLYIPPSTRLI